MTLIVKGIFIDCVDSEVNKKQQLKNRLNCGGVTGMPQVLKHKHCSYTVHS